ncbi:DNA polymerase [Chryseobacterium culicis]|uniref:DNA-directed DNA polymerase n=1 Tax=Chryseobacterium culicis TaxID=680127 RepID=A0A2S9CMS9_CHRCI|nr:DNA polymerase [Chryseobacterium culicis]PRB81811.1 hypothetical protein CQ022_19265 [Chryseobacterium culicis]PRB88466.1 hypothetical protein CQ033_18170 [Chryseobacterium culicis]
MEVAILKYNRYEKGILKTYFFVKENVKDPRKEGNLDFLQIQGIKTIISFDFLSLISDIKDIHQYTFIDIEQQLKQILGLPKEYFEKTKKHWSFWYQLKNYVDDRKKIKEYRKIFENLTDNIKEDEVDKAMFLLVESIYKIYVKNKRDLQNNNELERFEKIEKSLNTILFERTQKGITINTELLKTYLKQIIIDLYEVRNKLQLEFGIFSSKDYSKIKAKILELGFSNNIDKIDKIGTEKYYNFLKYHQQEYELIGLLYKERRLNDSKSVLTRIGSLEENRVYPFFEYFGTVTSRILVKNPSFQQLKREYRKIITPDIGKELIYIDYCQFEAGILADIMQDEELIKMYISGDIYSEMEKLLPEFTRDKCKSLFFLYSYGASKDQIQKKYTSTDLEVFFGNFTKFQPFREELEKEFIEKKMISTLLGNHRYITPETELEENISWLVSQKIQGTASLILKKSIKEIYDLDKEIEFLLPMHDAILYQVPSSETEQKKKLIKRVFEEKLKEVCPSLVPKISFKNFTE